MGVAGFSPPPLHAQGESHEISSVVLSNTAQKVGGRGARMLRGVAQLSSAFSFLSEVFISVSAESFTSSLFFSTTARLL